MAITDKHPDYDLFAPQWQRCQEGFDGIDAIKRSSKERLPPLSAKQDEASYQRMIQRAEWSDAPEHTVRALVGAAMRVPPTIDGPQPLADEFMGDMTLTGQTLESVATDALRAVLITGRVGLYVDFDLARQRAYLRLIQAPSITNWAERADKTALTAVVIADQREEFDFAELTRTHTDRLRALQIGPGGQYLQRVFEAQDPQGNTPEAKRFEQISVTTPVLPNGQAASQIPFVFAGVGSNSATPDKPPMLGLTDTSIALYRNSALLERALIMASGRFYFLADREPPKDLEVYPGVVITGSNEDATLDEFGGDAESVGAIREAMGDKRQTLAMLGASMLQDLAVQETAEAAGIKASARMAVLRLAVNAVEEGMNKAVSFMAERHGEAGQLDVQLNREFVGPRIDPAILQVYLAMIRENRISYETFYALLTDADLTRPKTTADAEQQAIAMEQERQAPPAPPALPPQPGENEDDRFDFKRQMAE